MEQQESNDLTSQNRKTRIKAIREFFGSANPASTNYTGSAAKSNSHDLVSKLVAEADNLFNDIIIISQVDEKVNGFIFNLG